MANKVLVFLPKEVLKEAENAASKEHRSRSALIRDALRAYLAAKKDKIREQPASYTVRKPKSKQKKSFPNIEVVKFTGRRSAAIRGTRVPVHILISHLLMGETPETIVKEIVPHITLPQIYEAMQYYFIHQAEIDKERGEDTKETPPRLSKKAPGEKKYKAATSGSLSAEFAAWELASDEALENFEKRLKK